MPSAGEIVRASDVSPDTWESYGDGTSWTASSSNPSLGNGTWDGVFMQVGALVHFNVEITAGSTTTFGSGAWSIALPVTASGRRQMAVHAEANDNSAGAVYGVRARITASSSTAQLFAPATTAGNFDRSMNSGVPFTWASGDILSISGTYEAA